MRSLILLTLTLAVLLSGSFTTIGCATRAESGTWTPDSTLVYLGKKADDVTCTITFCEKVGKNSGKRIGVGREFEIMEGSRVRAFVDLENIHARGKRELSFHLVWIGPDDKTVFKKRIEYTPGDPETHLYSSMSLEPDYRSFGKYKLRVYLFRELMAEKSFELI